MTEQYEMTYKTEPTMFYAGIGSRKTPISICMMFRLIAKQLDAMGYTLRSGGADGADTAFENGATFKRIYTVDDCEQWCLEEAKKHMPARHFQLSSARDYIQRLIGRDMKQILGDDGKTPSDFVVCWTPNGMDEGGTGYAIRCALAHRIPVYNFKNDHHIELFYDRYLKGM